MSKHVHCPECQAENTAGSKFCNHCGARLPKSTSVLCPKCQSPNPHNNFYCDNCGGRLHPEQNNAPSEEEPIEPEASDLPTSAKMLSLPARQPGETGELDAGSLSDWLSNQSEESGTKENTGKLPRLSDLTPEEHRAAEDLPGWLIDTESEDLLIGSPDDITTEHFLHLIQDINEEEREKLSGLLNDPSIAGDSANLPDWLKDAAQPKQKDASPVQEDDHAEDADEIPDWLGGMEPPKTGLLGKAGAIESSPDEPDSVSDDLPDWLTAEPDETKTPAEAQTTDDIFADDALFEEDIPDWMLGGEQQAESSVEEQPIDEATLDAAAATSLTGWLSEFDIEDDEVDEETAVSPEELPEEEQSTPQRSLTDWLTAFDEEDLIAADQSTETPDQAAASTPEESLPEWLTGSNEATETDDEFDGSFADMATDEPLPTAEAEDIADWLDFDTATDASLSIGETGPLPDWLDELEPTAESNKQTDSSELDSTLADLFGESVDDATGELTWLEDDESEDEPEADDSVLEPLAGAIGAAALVDAISHADDDDEDGTLEDNPDWLSELAAFDPNSIPELVEDETAVSTDPPEQPVEVESEFDIEAIFEAAEATDADDFDFDIDDELLGVDEQTTGDWADIDGILAGTADNEAIPEWLEQLDSSVDSEIILEESDEAPPEEIPDWVANLRPDDTGQLTSALPSAMFLDSDAGDLLSETDDLADAELPDWLETSIGQKAVTADKDSAAEWYDFEGDGEEAPAELEAILADLPPAQAPEDILQKAQIPDWLEELKPPELVAGKAAPLTESRLESTGPLAGMPHTIPIEPIIAMPRAASTFSTYAVSAEQTQQARLLRQLVQEKSQPPQPDKPAIGVRGINGLRIIVAILILATLFLGLYGPTFLKSKPPATVPIPAAALNTAVSNAAGKTVLIAFEYTPALAGELNQEAAMLLAQLEANNSPILITSQYVAGTAVAEEVAAPYEVTLLGFIPGEAMGLRQLGDCLGENALVSPCTSLHNLSVRENLADTLADVSLVIILTGERSSLINWVEQVSVSSDVPLVVGATQALEPLVVPYYASAQIDGYLNGLPATVAYQQAYMSANTNNTAESLYGAQSLVLLVTAVILLVGGLAFSATKKKS